MWHQQHSHRAGAGAAAALTPQLPVSCLRWHRAHPSAPASVSLQEDIRGFAMVEALLESHGKDRKLRKQHLKVLNTLDVQLLPQGSCGTLHLSKMKAMNAGRQIYQIKRENILKSLQVV